MDIPKPKNSNNPQNQTSTSSGSPTYYGSSPKFGNFVGGPIVLTNKIPIKTYHSEDKWVQFKRGDVYKEQININDLPEIDEDGFETVRNKKQHIKP